MREGGKIKGNISILDIQYGNVWTNINGDLLKEMNLHYGDVLHVSIFHKGKIVYAGDAPYSQTFGAVAKGKPLSYLNSLLQLSFALNQGNFACRYHIGSGGEWSVEVTGIR